MPLRRHPTSQLLDALVRCRFASTGCGEIGASSRSPPAALQRSALGAKLRELVPGLREVLAGLVPAGADGQHRLRGWS